MRPDAAVDPASALERIRGEVTAIRGALPPGVESVTDPVVARYVVFPSGASDAHDHGGGGCRPNPSPETGPWHVHARVRGAPGAGYDRAAYRFRLSFNAMYPREPPDVHLLSICHHALVDPDKELSSLFYHPANLKPSKILRANDAGSSSVAGAEYDLGGVLRAVRAFLSRPLEIPRSDDDDDDDALERATRRLARDWASAAASNLEREEIIAAYLEKKAGGGPSDARLFDGANGWPREFYHPDLAAALDEDGRLSAASASCLAREEAPGVYSFPMLSDAGRAAIAREVEHFQRDANLPVRRPNSMNNYGLIVNEIGMERAVDALQRNILAPISEALFPAQGGGALDGHHSFVVQYEQGADLGLDMHTDDSDVTFNVCLGKEFTGAGLSFCGVLGGDAHRKLSLVYAHVPGRCVAHLGAMRHGADDLETGSRMNLIVWNHSSLYRRSDAYRWREVPEEKEPPDPRCLSYTHDKDFARFKEYPPGKEGFRETAWYPPRAEKVRMR